MLTTSVANIFSLDGMRAFLHFVCAFLFCVCFRSSKGVACLLLKEFEAEIFQCVDVILSMCVEGVVELL